ncbi:hypothetical protein ACSFBF_05205 [Variovorax sp. ZT5P49]|uniref:hypothetical protein n=1 Tax=Variovorax sp. ZT5P49 TaxID=3443733 RepID=UPI003F45547F
MNEDRVRTWQVTIVDCALTFLGLAILSLGAWAVWRENLGLAGTALGGGLVLLFAATIHRFESLKGLGMEAKTRELKASIDQAEVLTDQLKELVNFVGTNLVVLTSSMGRWTDAPPIMDAYQLSRRVKSMLEKANSDEKTIREALMPWAKTVAFDAVSAMNHEIGIDVRKSMTALQHQLVRPSADNTEVRTRIATIETYLTRRPQGADKWSLGEIAEEVGRLPEIAPELSDARRAELRSKAAAVQEQLRYLAEHLDFKDLEFWARFKRAHEIDNPA